MHQRANHGWLAACTHLDSSSLPLIIIIASACIRRKGRAARDLASNAWAYIWSDRPDEVAWTVLGLEIPISVSTAGNQPLRDRYGRGVSVQGLPEG